MLRSRDSRREQSLEAGLAPQFANSDQTIDPEQEALLADSVVLALLVVVETLAPAERIAFVLHDTFDLPFDQIAPIVGRSAIAARQLASRARRRVRGASVPESGLNGKRAIVDAFLSASRNGDFAALLELLDPEVVLRADTAAVEAGAAEEVRGSRSVAGAFSGRARGARPALVDGCPGAVWAPGGRPRIVFAFTILRGRIARIDLLAEPAHLEGLDLVILGR